MDFDFQQIITRLAIIREINIYPGCFPFLKVTGNRHLIHVLTKNLM